MSVYDSAPVAVASCIHEGFMEQKAGSLHNSFISNLS